MISFFVGNFPTEPGRPLIANMTANITWPSEVKVESNSDNTISDNKISKGTGGGPRVVYCHYVDIYGNDYNYPEEASDLQAWIDCRPLEILTQDRLGCGFTMINGYSVAYINLGNFPTPWSPGESLVLESGSGDNRYSILLDHSSSPIYCGFEPVIPESGLPKNTGIIHLCDIEGTPVVTVSDNTLTLNWNPATGAIAYNIYGSEDPYGTFTHLATTIFPTWQTQINENIKFYYVVGTNGNKNKPEDTIFVEEEKK
ncbi:MAG: hypothetical protein GQ534_11705 [Candidatus Delongbacteria bacterium]|nr:hypothetical protein [Candidatus Delongbacteria bacterium]